MKLHYRYSWKLGCWCAYSSAFGGVFIPAPLPHPLSRKDAST
jgi:hypothetical protein